LRRGGKLSACVEGEGEACHSNGGDGADGDSTSRNVGQIWPCPRKVSGHTNPGQWDCRDSALSVDSIVGCCAQIDSSRQRCLMKHISE
jgi:hypothetical protein